MRLFASVFATLGLVLPLGAAGPSSTAIRPVMTSPAISATAAVPNPTEREIVRDLARQAESELRTNILPFWLKHTRDRERGGFFGQIEQNLKVREDAPRGSLLTSRILWTFSAAHRRYRDPAYLKMAQWAYDDLLKRFWDKENGGVLWSVKASGKPLESRKQIYAQAFALYGLTEYHRATGDKVALERAITVFRMIEAHAYDRDQGGYFEAFTRDWKSLPEDTRSLMDTDEPKSQNTMLHIMVAYTNLFRVWPDDLLRRRLAELVDRMMTRVLDPQTKHLHLLLAADWSPRSQRISYGHDIEFSWLLTEAAELLGDQPLLARVRPLAVEIAQVVRAEGLDADGGLHNEGGPKGLLDASKDWWPQAESAVGFFNAYQLSGDATYLRASQRSWDFIAQRIVDRENGEWFWGRDPKGRVITKQPKVGLWKCPYHNGRACLELIDRAEKLLGAEAAK